MDVIKTYCGNHFPIQTTIRCLCCTFETNIMVCVKFYFNFTKRKVEISQNLERVKISLNFMI